MAGTWGQAAGLWATCGAGTVSSPCPLRLPSRSSPGLGARLPISSIPQSAGQLGTETQER